MKTPHWTEREHLMLPEKIKVNVEGQDLTYVEFGQENEDILIMTHFYYETFEGLLEELSKTFHIYALNARTTGPCFKTEDGTNDWNRQWATDTMKFAKYMGIEKFYYCGQSHGTYIGWRLIYDFPEILKGVISISSFAPWGCESEESIAKLQKHSSGIMSNSKDHFKVGESYMYDIPILRKWTDETWGPVDKSQMAGFVARGHAFKNNEEVRAWMKTIDLPILCIVGGRDFMVAGVSPDGDEGWVESCKTIKGLKAVTYQTEGHYMFCESPELIGHEAASWLEQLKSGDL